MEKLNFDKPTLYIKIFSRKQLRNESSKKFCKKVIKFSVKIEIENNLLVQDYSKQRSTRTPIIMQISLKEIMS